MPFPWLLVVVPATLGASWLADASLQPLSLQLNGLLLCLFILFISSKNTFNGYGAYSKSVYYHFTVYSNHILRFQVHMSLEGEGCYSTHFIFLEPSNERGTGAVITGGANDEESVLRVRGLVQNPPESPMFVQLPIPQTISPLVRIREWMSRRVESLIGLPHSSHHSSEAKDPGQGNHSRQTHSWH